MILLTNIPHLNISLLSVENCSVAIPRNYTFRPICFLCVNSFYEISCAMFQSTQSRINLNENTAIHNIHPHSFTFRKTNWKYKIKTKKSPGTSMHIIIQTCTTRVSPLKLCISLFYVCFIFVCFFFFFLLF